MPNTWLRATTLLRGSLVLVGDVRCHAPRSPFGLEEHASSTQVLLPRAGVFVVRSEGREVVADGNSAVVLRAGERYQVSHPVSGGDRCTVFVLPPDDLAEEVLRGSRDAGLVPIKVQLAVRLLTASLRHDVVDELEGDELAARVLSSVGSALADAPQRRPARNEVVRRRVADIQAVLTSAPSTRWSLESLAKTVPCSSFHLTRQFRAVTGMSIAGYLVRLRVGIALERLASGESDLARLAADLGFSSHSHFSARFRALLGTTPSRLRDQLTRPTREQLRTNLTARRAEQA